MDNFILFLSANKKVFTCYSIAIGLPSTLLYCAEIWTILWHKPFHNSFYTLFVVRASTDLVGVLSSYFFNRMSILFPEWFLALELPNWSYAFFNFYNGYMFVSDNLAMAFILANRYTAIARPTTHEHIWRKFMPLVFLIVFGVPLYNVRLFLLNTEVFVERDGQGRVISIYYADANNGTTLNAFIGFNTLLSVLFLAFCIPINMAILWAYRKRRNHQVGKQPNQQQQQQGITIGQQRMNGAAKAKADLIERRLLLFAIITFIGHILIAIWLATLYFAFAIENVFLIALMTSQLNIVVDFGFVVLPSWLLLWASSSFRRQLLATFLPIVLHRKMFSIPHSNNVKNAQQAATGLKINVATIIKNVQINPFQK